MRKLKQKEWLTLPDAAKYLTEIVQGPGVSEADLIQYALDDELTISMRMNFWINDYCCPYGNLETIAEADLHRDLVSEIASAQSDTSFFWYKRQRYTTRYDDMTNLMPGTYDIASGGDSDEIINTLWVSLVEGSNKGLGIVPPSNPQLNNEGGERVRFCKYLNLVDPIEKTSVQVPDYLIPSGSYFVIRKSEVDSLLDPETEKCGSAEISTKEKKTYLKVIRALCEDHKDIDLSQHSTAAGQLMAMADALGLTTPSKRTLENLLKEARDLED